MKTAQEWRAVWQGDCCPLPDLDQIQAIQQDAYKSGLLRAVQVCQDHRPRHGYNSATGWAIHDAAKAIEAEAQKGQP